MIAKLTSLYQFATRDVWRIRLNKLRGKDFYLIKIVRIAVLSGRGFVDDGCSLRASALTFYTMLSIIPIFAMAFGIAKGFGLQTVIERQILLELKGQEEAAKWLIDFAYSFLANTQGGVIAGIGVAMLFYTVIKVLNSIESSFNAIWHTESQRNLTRKITDYLSIMLIAPIFWIIASSLTVFIAKEVHTAIGKVSILSQVSTVIQFALQFAPYLVTWMLFSFIYIVMPNKKVQLCAGLTGGVIAGTLYQAFQYFYINFQIGVSKYNAIYGSFAALPLFLVWLQTSWLILLYGAEISFAYQNAEEYELEPDSSNISYWQKKLMMLTTVYLIVKRFDQEGKSYTARQISEILDIPIILMRELLRELVASHIVSAIQEAGSGSSAEASDLSYQPALDIGRMTISRVVAMWERHGLQEVPFGHSEELSKMSRRVQDLFSMLQQSPEDELLKNI